MKHCIHQTRLFTSLAGAILTFTLSTTQAQTYTWDQQALGQPYLVCLVPGLGLVTNYWPISSVWSQSVHTNGGCDGTGTVISAPSNWSPAPPVGVYPGGPGAVGVDVVLGAPANTVLDAIVTLNSLTIQANGALSIAGQATANLFDFQGDGALVNGGIIIAAGGTLVKSGGTGTYSLTSGAYVTQLAGNNATIEVKSGTLAFPAGNNYTFLHGGGTFAVSNNATLILAPDDNTGTSLIGDFSGVGGGTVLFNTGFLISSPGPGFSLNLPGNMFQWTGGWLYGAYCTNNGTINISNNITNTPGIYSNNPAIYGSRLYNNGMVKMADGSTLASGNGTVFNQPGGTFDFQGDAGITSPSGGGGFYNSGLLKKSAGAGTTQIPSQFQNYGGTVEVDTGTLAVNLYSGNVISNATFIVQGGATLDLCVTTNFSNTEIEGVLMGSGGGTVLMNSGNLFCNYEVTLNFPGSMFQWAGGRLGSVYAFLTNAGTINLSGPVVMGNQFANNGTIIQGGAGGNGGGFARFANNVGGVYQIQNDNGVAIWTFDNYGLLEKTGGSGTSVIDAVFNNSGAIQATSGTLLFAGGTFNQNAGTLQLTPSITFDPSHPFYLNGGTVTGVGTLGSSFVSTDGGVLAPGNPFGTLSIAGAGGLTMYNTATLSVVLGGSNQFSQVAVSHGLDSQGTLSVTLTNGYAPAIGTQFQIMSCGNRSSFQFATLNVPRGISVNYSNTGVYLLVTGPVPAQLQSPQVSGGNLSFSFGTANGQSYTVQQNTNLATTNWTFYTNITGDGSPYEFTTSVTNIPQQFFRINQP